MEGRPYLIDAVLLVLAENPGPPQGGSQDPGGGGGRRGGPVPEGKKVLC